MEKDVNEIVSIAIPSKTEKFLQRTIQDVLEKADGPIEIYPILDGYEPPAEEIVKDPRVHYIRLPKANHSQKRQGINKMVSVCNGKFVMSVDAHCMFDKGFDTILKRDWQPKWVMIPRRHRLDAENWCLQPQSDSRPPIDYEYYIFRGITKKDTALHGFKWDKRTLDEWGVPIANTLAFQGSCWFMTKEWFNERGFMDLNYMGWGQEAEEISMETWKNGGRVVTDKNTWYAHLHKGKKYGRMYWMSRAENRKSYAYSFNRWIIEHNDFFIGLVKKFSRMPGWPDDWEERLRKLKITGK